jgi:phosphate:Na+ symporter
MSNAVYGTLTLLDLAGAVALLLWGVHMVQSGVQRAFGSEFRRILSRGFRGRLQAFAAGLGVTAVLQSSTATCLMVTSFAAGGFVALVPALAAMLGANVGTTLIVQVLSFDVSPLSPLLLLVGVVAFRAGATRTRDLGRVAIGLGLMLIALSRLLEVVTRYEDILSLRILMAGDRDRSRNLGAVRSNDGLGCPFERRCRVARHVANRQGSLAAERRDRTDDRREYRDGD